MRRITSALTATVLALSACGTSESDPSATGGQDTLSMPADDARCTEEKKGARSLWAPT